MIEFDWGLYPHLDRERDAPAVVRLMTMYLVLETLSRRIVGEGEVRTALVDVYNRTASNVLRLEAELMLTPSTRGKLGIPGGSLLMGLKGEP